MDKTTKGAWIASICAMVVASISVGGWFWRGGELAGTIVNVTKAIESLQSRQERTETLGTSGLRAHIDLANERHTQWERRLKLLEDTINTVALMQADVREIKVRMQMLEQIARDKAVKPSTTTGGLGW